MLINLSKQDWHEINLTSNFTNIINLSVNKFYDDINNSWMTLLTVKAVCNALSTGAHIFKGTLFHPI